MSIHISYKKKELVEIIQNNNININIKWSRDNICKELLKVIDKYNLHFLYNENENKTISVQEKDKIISIARKIKSFINSGLDLNKNIYNNNDELIFDTVYISNYGEISSVRKAVKLVEYTLNIKIPLQIPEKIKKELYEKEQLKKKQIPCLQVNNGKYYVNFD